MKKNTIIAAAALGLMAFTAVPAQADGFYFGFQSGHGGVGIYTNGNHRGHQSWGHRRHAPRYYVPQYQHEVMSRRQIRRALRHRGFHDFHKIKRKGNRYVVVAENRRGRLLRLKIDAYSGQILRRKVIRY
ncbi:MAG: hypothetical protein JKY99_06695 [Rhizobiales bacterium]|nr:hypothetical protein [Hyphomicrobiales bacterium]